MNDELMMINSVAKRDSNCWFS